MFGNLIAKEMIDILYQNEEFCLKLGKIMLKASKLEEQLIILVKNDKSESNPEKPNTGMLIKYIENKEFFPALVPVLYKLNENNINSGLIIAISKSIVNMTNLNDTDINGYLERISSVEEKIYLVYTIIKEHNKITV